jgi:hypothetical protein
MSLYNYKESQEIRSKDYGFYSLIMAAIFKADDINMEKFKMCWPDIYEEAKARYNAPGGILPKDE